MCCDNCDHFFRCEEVEHKSALCCGKCEDQDGCHRPAASGRYVMDFEDEYDGLLDDTDDYDDDEDEDDDYDDEDEDDDYGDEDSTSIH